MFEKLFFSREYLSLPPVVTSTSLIHFCGRRARPVYLIEFGLETQLLGEIFRNLELKPIFNPNVAVSIMLNPPYFDQCPCIREAILQSGTSPAATCGNSAPLSTHYTVNLIPTPSTLTVVSSPNLACTPQDVQGVLANEGMYPRVALE